MEQKIYSNLKENDAFSDDPKLAEQFFHISTDLYEKLTGKKKTVLFLSQLLWLQNLNHSADFIYIWFYEGKNSWKKLNKKKQHFLAQILFMYISDEFTCADGIRFEIQNASEAKRINKGVEHSCWFICVFISIVLKETDFSRFRSQMTIRFKSYLYGLGWHEFSGDEENNKKHFYTI